MMPNYPDSDSALDQALACSSGTAHVRQTLTLCRDWRSTPDSITLEPTYRISGDGRVQARLEDHEIFLDEPVLLEPVHIAKPWGQEIWHSGIEARGECGVRTPAGVLPLSHYLALAPRRLTGGLPLVLLKILDPDPEPVLGDLYFETHEQKQEVYVVTHVDPEAWPDGSGGIRFGMNQDLRRRYADDDAFRRDYLAAVQAYEAVRRDIDAGVAVAAGREAELRAAMNAFTGMRELRVGDVVVVPTWLPHSLQHGVRVVEFQTPTYERYIISFAQQVLTQDHWDTEAAVARMHLDVPAPPRFEQLADGVENIVTFDDFRVWRVRVPAGSSLALPVHASYLLCMGVQGQVTVGNLTLAPEQAAFVPGAALSAQVNGAGIRLPRDAASKRLSVLLAAADL
ncbi:MAG: hypothetical protein U5Q16_07160 [Gammaproteobacteria bacterium]|nr:hypothetical protein [Gammaproteobacteria bacterium]